MTCRWSRTPLENIGGFDCVVIVTDSLDLQLQ